MQIEWIPDYGYKLIQFRVIVAHTVSSGIVEMTVNTHAVLEFLLE